MKELTVNGKPRDQYLKDGREELVGFFNQFKEKIEACLEGRMGFELYERQCTALKERLSSRHPHAYSIFNHVVVYLGSNSAMDLFGALPELRAANSMTVNAWKMMNNLKNTEKATLSFYDSLVNAEAIRVVDSLEVALKMHR